MILSTSPSLAAKFETCFTKKNEEEDDDEEEEEEEEEEDDIVVIELQTGGRECFAWALKQTM